ncbi:hypothetical protein [Hoeflea prorocentri]|uniref:DUF2007 domain-containing protein n=1 Tax=Hoeflea prorocentri TaxID=1922333 RepID=A0A9X3ZI38_9HYPH|nr:hypothetical protein [Hoeflea prorocentri]MCY6382019.1 hypothetical protein [Hoeflea prorocentri]MDA5399819.1 hypothetical protein [Hoeflea prorocentri]
MPNLETIAVVYDLPAALCLKSALESQGILVFVDGLHHASVDWWVTVALGGMQVRVIDRDATAARDYLQHVEGERVPQSPISSDIWRRPVTNGLLLFFGMMLASTPIWLRTRPRGLNQPPQVSTDGPPATTSG